MNISSHDLPTFRGSSAYIPLNSYYIHNTNCYDPWPTACDEKVMTSLDNETIEKWLDQNGSFFKDYFLRKVSFFLVIPFCLIAFLLPQRNTVLYLLGTKWIFNWIGRYKFREPMANGKGLCDPMRGEFGQSLPHVLGASINPDCGSKEFLVVF